jgi:flavin reductase (DIM6/NTAB) family NADH-FMN oxidoreductase RutF
VKTRRYRRRSVPLIETRRHLEPGPAVLVTSAWRGRRDVMTMNWHTVMEFTPALVGCVISEANDSFDLVRGSRECVLNVPQRELLDVVVGIGTTHGTRVDKFARFGLATEEGEVVKAPLLPQCYASFECRLHDARLVKKYNFFVWEVVRAWVSPTPRRPETVHYSGEGVFRVAGATLRRDVGKLL